MNSISGLVGSNSEQQTGQTVGRTVSPHIMLPGPTKRKCCIIRLTKRSAKAHTDNPLNFRIGGALLTSLQQRCRQWVLLGKVRCIYLI